MLSSVTELLFQCMHCRGQQPADKFSAQCMQMPSIPGSHQGEHPFLAVLSMQSDCLYFECAFVSRYRSTLLMVTVNASN